MKPHNLPIASLALSILALAAAPATAFFGMLMPKLGAQLPESMAVYWTYNTIPALVAVAAIVLGALAFAKLDKGRVMAAFGIGIGAFALLIILSFNPLTSHILRYI